MRLDRAPVTVLLILVALAAIQAIHYYPALPNELVVHFNAAGEPNGWSQKGSFMLTYAITEAMVVVLGVGLAFLIERVPPSLVNIPHRQYWLAPERRKETAEFLANQLMWIEAATLLFLMAIAQIVYVKNLSADPPRLSRDIWYLVAAFAVAVVWLSLRIILRFGRRGQEEPGVM